MTKPSTNAKVENENSIEQIEKKIDTLKKGPKAKAKATQAEIKRLKSALNKMYIEYKVKVLEFERKNKSHLVFLRSTNGFYKLMENSLYFYAYDIAPKLELDVKVYADNDYEVKAESGITSVMGVDGVKKKLAKLKIKPMKTKDSTGNIVIFKIPWEYTEKEIEKFKEENTNGTRKYNQVIVAHDTIPTLYLNISTLLKDSYENVRRLDPVARDGFANVILKREARMVDTYIEMANGRMNEREGLMLIKHELDMVKSRVKLLVDLKLWNANAYARVGGVYY